MMDPVHIDPQRIIPAQAAPRAVPPGETQAAQTHIGAMIAAMAKAGLGVRLHTDPAGFQNFAVCHDGHDPASPLDHHLVRLDERNFFWLKILELATHQPVAVGAARMLEAPADEGGLDGLLYGQRLFADRAAMLYAPPFSLADDSGTRSTGIAGRIGYIGGCWTHPAWRGRSVIGFTCQLAMAHLYGPFGVDYAVGFVRPRHTGLALSPTGYSFTRQLRFETEYCAGTGTREVLHLAWVARDELTQRYRCPAIYQPPEHPAPSLWERRSSAA